MYLDVRVYYVVKCSEMIEVTILVSTMLLCLLLALVLVAVAFGGCRLLYVVRCEMSSGGAKGAGMTDDGRRAEGSV